MVMDTSRPSVFTLSNEDGVNRVLKGKGKYAFFMESSAIDYYTKRHCNLKMVGPKLDSKEYGIAMPKSEWISSKFWVCLYTALHSREIIHIISKCYKIYKIK